MSKLLRTYSYDDEGSPVMVIYKKTPRVTTFRLKIPTVEAYIIPLSDAWMYSRACYPALVRVFYGFGSAGEPLHGEEVLSFEQAMYARCNELCIQFDLGLITAQRMAQIASMIEDGISDLLAMPPQGNRPGSNKYTENVKVI